MFGLIKKILVGLLAGLVNRSWSSYSCKVRLIKQLKMYDSSYSY